jgi:hypothetical protein
MKKFATLLTTAALSISATAQSASTPQTARQALIEMFFGKTPGTLVKHLPAATLAALDQSGAAQTLRQYSMLAGQLQNNGNRLETFETGSVLLITTDSRTGHKFEAIVESDSLQGEEDNIEVSLHSYKENQMQKTPFMPVLTFSMKMEAGVWKLNEIDVSIRLPLADPDFLKSISEAAKSTASRPAPTLNAKPSTLQSPPTPGARSFDASVAAAMSSITSAEAIYSATYRSVGYTCTLSDLDGFGGGEPNEHQAMLISSSLASGKKYGYEFNLSGCTGSPATSFQLTAVPRSSNFGQRAFCTDKTGTLRASVDGKAATCLASGTPVQ